MTLAAPGATRFVALAQHAVMSVVATVPAAEPATGRLGALDDLPKVVVRSVTSGSPCAARSLLTRGARLTVATMH